MVFLFLISGFMTGGPGLIEKMHRDERFESDKDKRWSLAKEDAPEERDPKKNGRGTGSRSVVNPEQDEQRMAKWRSELGPDKKPNRPTEEVAFVNVYDLTPSCCSLGGARTGSSCSHFFPGGVCTLTPSLRSRVTSSVLSEVKMTV